MLYNRGCQNPECDNNIHLCTCPSVSRSQLQTAPPYIYLPDKLRSMLKLWKHWLIQGPKVGCWGMESLKCYVVTTL